MRLRLFQTFQCEKTSGAHTFHTLHTDDEEYDCEPNKRRKLRYSPSAWLSCFHLHGSWPVAQRKSAWTSWFCQYLGVPIPQLLLLARRQDADRPSQSWTIVLALDGLISGSFDGGILG